MLIVGELINTSSNTIGFATENRDAGFIHKIALEQVEAGADYIDVNCGTMIFNELETIEWLVSTVQEKTRVPLCIDSPNPKAVDAALALCKYGQPMINSITDERERFESILPLILKYKAKVVALCMNDSGMPETGEDRTRVAKSLYDKLTMAGVPAEDIYFDPLVQPISSNDQAGHDVLRTVRLIRDQYPDAHMICGLSNISYGLPNRRLLNRFFLVQTMTVGIDSYILNPTDKEIMGAFSACKALLGHDSYCMGYLDNHRKGLFGLGK